ncbi:MAG: cyclic nucleotide-binding domain-containing protein, partial [Chloroflexi bacterium]|nr:cyclic nucleotide-binding domain-containing protein [Chloroflexota bacterium]
MSTGDRLRSQVAQDSSPFAFLAAHHLFGVLPPEELRSLVAEVAERRYRKGHHVFFPGDVPSQVYVVKQGLISLTKGDEHGTARVLLTYGCG